MSAEKDKSKVHKLSLKGSSLALSKPVYQMLTNTIGSSKLIAEFVGQKFHQHYDVLMFHSSSIL